MDSGTSANDIDVTEAWITSATLGFTTIDLENATFTIGYANARRFSETICEKIISDIQHRYLDTRSSPLLVLLDSDTFPATAKCFAPIIDTLDPAVHSLPTEPAHNLIAGQHRYKAVCRML